MSLVDLGPLSQARGREVRYYSLARHALLNALRLAGVGPGGTVLLPAFICRDLLAPIAILGARPVWYHVDHDLKPLDVQEDWPTADAVLAINYFGFPQELDVFHQYVARTRATLIEDNAHGYLSRSEDGLWLGTRCSLGIISVRKTIRIPDGAALVVSNSSWLGTLPPQAPFCGKGLNPAQYTKARIRSIPIIGEQTYRAATRFARLLRKQRTGCAIPRSDPESETIMPASPDPWVGLADALVRCNAKVEVSRRRAAYAESSHFGEKAGVVPVFSHLPENCAPYGYAFRGAEKAVAMMRDFSLSKGFDFVTWPDLPMAFEKTAPIYYRNVYLINYLW